MEIASALVLGQAIRHHRRRSGLSQRQLADLAGIGKTSVFDMEKGKATMRLTTIMAVTQILNIQLSMNSPLMAEFAAKPGTPGSGERP